MKKSIGMKIFLGIMLFSLIIIGIVWLLNIKFLGGFYLEKKKESVMEYGQYIQSIYNEDIDKIDIDLARIGNAIGGNITIATIDGEIIYSSSYSQQNMRMGRGNMRGNPYSPFQIIGENLNEVYNGETVLNVYNHPRFASRILILTAPLGNDAILFMETSVAAIEEGVEITKEFYIYIGIISLLIGAVVAYGFSRIISSPIVELNEVARKMAKLDFSHKYNIRTNDEIGELGETINYLSYRLDKTINDLNSANEELKEDIEKERGLEVMRKEFISSVSHELKTPISLIQGYSEGLRDNIAGDEGTKQFYCNVIVDEAQRMDKLVKDLLDLSQLESGQLKLEKELFDMSNLIERTLEKYGPIFSEKGIKITIDKRTKNFMVFGDRERIEQIITNFIKNGMNHADYNRDIKITLKENDGNLRVGVYNSGANIPGEDIEKIWDRFYKIDKARSRKYGGTGLGLSIVKRILELHDSSFGVENHEEGVEFWFIMKLVDR